MVGTIGADNGGSNGGNGGSNGGNGGNSDNADNAVMNVACTIDCYPVERQRNLIQNRSL